MKHTLIALASALALGSTAYAGSTDYTATTSPAPSTPLYKWFAGGSVGYLTGDEEAYYTIHFGMKFADTGTISQSVFLEGGFARVYDGFADSNVIPVMLNYQLDYRFSQKWSAYAGVGAGVAFLNTKTPLGGDTNQEFAAQGFAGIGYDITPALEIYGGARYIWLNDAKVNGYKQDLGGDLGVELGARFRF